MGAQGVDSLHTHTIQTYRLLESLRVVLTTCIEYADSLDEFALRDASTIVANGDAQIFIDIDFNPLASLHLKLVNRVVNDLLQQNIDTILRK